MPDWQVPDSISPSRMTLWQQCPLKFRVESMQKLRSGTNAAAVAGTTAHLALEWLMQLPGPERRISTLVDGLIPKALTEIKETDDYLSLSPEDLKGFDAKVKRVTPRLFDMIDVPHVKVKSTEMRFEVDLDGWTLRGIIDLLLGEERLYVWDHKSGKTPSPQYQAKAMEGIQFYAVAVEIMLGEIPAKIALGYLDSRTKIAAVPTERSVSVTKGKILRTRDEISKACDTGVWKTKTSALCNWCQLQPVCPAHGGSEDAIQALVDLSS